jgi:hypothetical protein
MHDDIVILSEVCMELYESDECLLPDGLVRMEVDGRGEAYRDEFLREVRDFILSGLQEQKQIRLSHDDL